MLGISDRRTLKNSFLPGWPGATAHCIRKYQMHVRTQTQAAKNTQTRRCTEWVVTWNHSHSILYTKLLSTKHWQKKPANTDQLAHLFTGRSLHRLKLLPNMPHIYEEQHFRWAKRDEHIRKPEQDDRAQLAFNFKLKSRNKLDLKTWKRCWNNSLDIPALGPSIPTFLWKALKTIENGDQCHLESLRAAAPCTTPHCSISCKFW